MTFLLADSASIPNWSIQLGIAVPFILALGYVGKWLFSRLKDVEAEKKALYDKLIDQILPALKSSTDTAEKLIEQFEKLDSERRDVIEISVELRQKLTEANSVWQKAVEFAEELRRRELSIARAGRKGGQ